MSIGLMSKIVDKGNRRTSHSSHRRDIRRVHTWLFCKLEALGDDLLAMHVSRFGASDSTGGFFFSKSYSTASSDQGITECLNGCVRMYSPPQLVPQCLSAARFRLKAFGQRCMCKVNLAKDVKVQCWLLFSRAGPYHSSSARPSEFAKNYI